MKENGGGSIIIITDATGIFKTIKPGKTKIIVEASGIKITISVSVLKEDVLPEEVIKYEGYE